MGSVSLTDIHKSFGGVKVLHDITVAVNDGEFVVLVGPSGCGKSTLLRCIAGLEEVTSGDIHIDGVRVNTLAPKRRDIAMVFQNYALYPHMTVAQNMGFSLRLARADAAEIRAKVERAAAILGLEDLLERYPRQLSGGQRQRVAMGRAIVRNPKVFLFDEPLSNLDAKLRVQMRSEIKQLHQRLGSTIIYVTHDQIEAMTMADRIVVMRGGRVEQVGAPLELYDAPANVFVAGFIGSPAMNLFPARLSAGNLVIGDAGALPAGPDAPAGDRPVIAGMRPEDMELSDSGIPVEVILAEPTGAETQLLARLGAHTVVVTMRGRLDVRPGQRIGVSVRPGKLHLFDPDTETTLRPAPEAQNQPQFATR
jgi:multiple sugar transport system ATP-binding protein